MAFTLRDLTYSETDGRYYYPSGRAVSQSQLDKFVKRVQAEYLRDIIADTNRLVAGELPLQDWEKNTITNIKDSHVAMMRIGRGGKNVTYGIHYLDVATELRRNQYPAFRKLVQDLKDGKMSRRQLDARLASYVRASEISYQKGKESYNRQYAVRKINDRAENCPDCVRYAAMGIQPVGVLPIPMTACQCRSNCKCTIHYGSYQDLLKLRSGWLA